jgi:DNA polymerase
MDPAHARAALDWLLELGADEAIGDEPVDRTALAAQAPRAAPVAPPPVPTAPAVPAAPKAEDQARGAPDLAALAAAMEAFDCELKAGAQNFVLSDGTPGAPLMVIGEAPGRDEDRAGKPFVGPAGQLLDRMLGAIGRDRADPAPAAPSTSPTSCPGARPATARPPTPRWPAGRPSCAGTSSLRARASCSRRQHARARAAGPGGITRMRGEWREALGLPALPTFHPSYLLRLESQDRDAWKKARAEVWADLQSVQARLETP